MKKSIMIYIIKNRVCDEFSKDIEVFRCLLCFETVRMEVIFLSFRIGDKLEELIAMIFHHFSYKLIEFSRQPTCIDTIFIFEFHEQRIFQIEIFECCQEIFGKSFSVYFDFLFVSSLKLRYFLFELVLSLIQTQPLDSYLNLLQRNITVTYLYSCLIPFGIKWFILSRQSWRSKH